MGRILKFVRWFRQLFKVQIAEPVESLSRVPSEAVERRKEQFRHEFSEWQPEEKIVTVYSSNKKFVDTIQAVKANRERRTKFSHAEHFKRRQPTTARKLWNPNAKIEDEN